MMQTPHFKGRRPFSPIQEPPEEEIIPRNINAECPRAILAKKEEIEKRRIEEGRRMALEHDLELEHALKVVDGQWYLSSAKRKTRTLRRRREREARRIARAKTATTTRQVHKRATTRPTRGAAATKKASTPRSVA